MIDLSQKRVLHCINGMGSGGAEKDIINWMHKLIKRNIYFDFLVRSDDLFYRKEILNMGGNIYRVSSFPQRFIKNIIETNSFFKNNNKKYDAVHVHGNSALYIIPLIFAKKYNIPVRIFHVHSTKTTNCIGFLFHRINIVFVKKYANVIVGCSKNALQFICSEKKGIIIKNMINTNEIYKIREPMDDVKQKYNLQSFKYVFIHIGRFLDVKNHTFLIDVFREILKLEPSSCLLLVGTGPLLDKIKSKVCKYHLEEKVIFLGESTEINILLNLSNMMIFPSLYEGIPLTVIEAQATMTKVIASDNIDKESAITPYVDFFSLKKDEKKWAEEAIHFLHKEIICNIDECFKMAKYDLDEQINTLHRIYDGKTK